MTIWKKYEVTNYKTDTPCVAIRRSGFALNVAFMVKAKLAIGDYVEIFISEESDRIGFRFFKDKMEGRLTITNDGGGKSRCVDVNKANGFIACSYIKNDKLLSTLVSTKNAKVSVVADEGMWVICITPSWEHNAQDRKPKFDEIGVYRYSLEGDVVYIGRGRIQQRLSGPERTHWNFDKVEYDLMSEMEAEKRESRLIKEHRTIHGRLPFYNRNIPNR